MGQGALLDAVRQDGDAVRDLGPGDGGDAHVLVGDAGLPRGGRHLPDAARDRPLKGARQGVDDDLPGRIHLTAHGDALVVADPRHSFGQPIVESSGARVEGILGMFKGGIGEMDLT
jgi:hypothetical protein